MTRRTCRSAAGADSSSARAAPTGNSAVATATGAETRAGSPSAPTASTARTFRRENHLEKFVGVFEEILELVALRTESLSGKLRGDFNSGDGRIFRNVSDFVDLDARFAGKRGFQLFRQRGWLGVAAGKCAHKSGELRLRQIG